MSQLLESDDELSFASLELHPELLESLETLGFSRPTPIQRYSIPVLLENHDLIGQAATGTGKTAAFALPILQRLSDEGRTGQPRALILVPTRELALQVANALSEYGKALGASVAAIYGGESFPMQRKALRDGVDVVVATPGRALDHLKRGTLQLDQVQTVVLDEADEMLDMGFAEELNAIFDFVPETRQTVLFSATLPKKIEDLARRYLSDPKRIRVEASSKTAGTIPKVKQVAYVVQRANKPRALARLLDSWGASSAIVFCRTRDHVDTLASTLSGMGYQAEAIHGGLSQEQRGRVLSRLRSEAATLMVATDVAARGLDIDHLTHVVNYEVPRTVDTYTHRIGRVGRAGRTGIAVTFVEPQEHRALVAIERMTKQQVSVEPLPSAQDVEALRKEALVTRVVDASQSPSYGVEQSLWDDLIREHGLEAVARGALRLLSESTKSLHDTQDFPHLELGRRGARNGRVDRSDRRDRGDRSDRSDRSDRGARNGRATLERDGRNERRQGRKGREREFERENAGEAAHGGETVRRPRRADRQDEVQETRFGRPKMVRLYVGVGATEEVEPRDLVGAFTGEAELVHTEVGHIEIAPRFSLVEVPSHRADEVIQQMRGASIRGRKLNVRRERTARSLHGDGHGNGYRRSGRDGGSGRGAGRGSGGGDHRGAMRSRGSKGFGVKPGKKRR